MYHQNLSEFRFHHSMDAAEERRLIRAARGGDDDAYVALWNRFQLLVIQLCRKFTGGWIDADDGDDIVSEGNLALREAVLTFKPRRGARLATWLRFILRRRVLAYLEKRAKLAGPDRAGTVPIDTGFAVCEATSEASWWASRPESESPGVSVETADAYKRAMQCIAKWTSRDRRMFLSRVRGTTFNGLTSYLPEGTPKGRRNVSAKFAKLCARLRRELAK